CIVARTEFKIMMPARKLLLLLMILSTASACIRTGSPLQGYTAAPDFETRKDEPSPGFTGERVRLIGRFDLGREGRARFTWPGSAMEFRFEGTAAGIGIAADDRVRFRVTVDGEESELWTTPGER